MFLRLIIWYSSQGNLNKYHYKRIYVAWSECLKGMTIEVLRFNVAFLWLVLEDRYKAIKIYVTGLGCKKNSTRLSSWCSRVIQGHAIPLWCMQQNHGKITDSPHTEDTNHSLHHMKPDEVYKIPDFYWHNWSAGQFYQQTKQRTKHKHKNTQKHIKWQKHMYKYY